MNNIARICSAEILRATFGSDAAPAHSADLARLNQSTQHLASGHDAQELLRAIGYAAAGMSVVDVARSRYPAEALNESSAPVTRTAIFLNRGIAWLKQ